MCALLELTDAFIQEGHLHFRGDVESNKINATKYTIWYTSLTI